MILANQLIQRMQVHHHLIPLSRFQPNSEAIGVARRFHAPCSSNSRFSNDGSCQKMTSSAPNTATRPQRSTCWLLLMEPSFEDVFDKERYCPARTTQASLTLWRRSGCRISLNFRCCSGQFGCAPCCLCRFDSQPYL